MSRVVVIGAGVVGLSAAFALQQRGWQVTVIEARTPGYGASRVNAGMICPSLPGPVPSPGLVKTSIKWMRKSDSPLYIQPRPNPAMLRWLTTFWRHCNQHDYDAGIEATVALNRQTFACYDRMRVAGVIFEEHRQGLLFAFFTTAALERVFDEHVRLTRFGVPAAQLLDALQIHKLEPALSDDIVGGFWYEQDRHVRPDTLTGGLVDWLIHAGVRLRTGIAVTGLETQKGKVTNVVTTDGRIETDAVLLCAGVWTPEIAAMAGCRVPIQAGKGYCLDFSPSPHEVTHPIDLPENRMLVTPMLDRTRFAGTMEFSGINEKIRPERVAAIYRGGARALRDWPTEPGLPTIGSGLRPMSADGLPLIGLLPGFQNLAIASGHGMLGVTLSAATADAVAELLTTGTAPGVLAPFDPARF